ncbi:MAG: HAMP domain-containing protein [Gemmatimonas sp.]|nr:HAMP domain-containing protein [Gemmatimonas sp.]
MRVATKLSAAFGLLVLVLAGLLVYHARTNRNTVSANYELAEISTGLDITTTGQISAINRLDEAADKYRVTRDVGYLELFEEAYQDFDEGLRLLSLRLQTTREREEIGALQEIWRDFGPAETLIGSRIGATDTSGPSIDQLLPLLRSGTRRVADASQAAMRERLEASAGASRQAEQVSWIVGATALLLTLIVSGFIVRSTSQRLARLQKGTHQVALGNFDHRLPETGSDEFSELAHDFNTMTRRLGELDRMKRDFLSKVSHDLKTPLASMHETVQVMLDGVPGALTGKQRRLLELTQQSAGRLSSMIIKILDLSAIEAGAMVLEMRQHEIRSILEPAIDALTLGDPGRSPQIITDLPADPMTIICDRDRLVQVVVNLLENAAKFSPSGGLIRVAARYVDADDRSLPALRRQFESVDCRVGAAALIEVDDRGRGVPDPEKRKIFENYFQSGRGNRSAGGGVGLGLAICREIVDLHGGFIWVRDNPGGGSSFAILLPHATIEPRAAAAAGADAPKLHIGSA